LLLNPFFARAKKRGIRNLTAAGKDEASTDRPPWGAKDWALWVASLIAIVMAALMWLLASMAVAFPGDVLTGQFSHLFDQFFHGISHPLSVVFLLFTDIVIAILLLQEARVSQAFQGKLLGIVLTAIILYGVVTLALPAFNAGIVTAHTLGLGLFAFFLIGIPRAVSYGAPVRAKRVSI